MHHALSQKGVKLTVYVWFNSLKASINPFCPPPPTSYPKGTPPPPPAASNIVSLDTEADVVVDESRTAKKRHWTLDEEERLVITYI
jgi:hypothetical protein